MNVSIECVPCIINNFVQLLNDGVLPEESRESILRSFLKYIAEEDYGQSPPALGRKIHQMIRQELNDPDPYKKIKAKYNRMLLDLYPEFKKMVQESDDAFYTALRLAVAGNVIDFGSQHQFEIMETIDRVQKAEFFIDDSASLRKDLKKAKIMMYIGDNCGEIVLDRLFLETIPVPVKYFVVRGGPVINDITMDDAMLTGINKVAKIITTGDNAPGAVWETTSDEFKYVFNAADVIISKGQGNLEGLIDVPGNNYFLFVSKCDLIARRVGAHKGDFIIKKNSSN